MLNTFIKNRGTTKTIVYNNNRNLVNQVDWDADYDGNQANISFDTNNNGNYNHYDFTLDNQDLADILNVQSVNMPIDKRLKMDFKEPSYIPEPYYIELPTPKFEPREPKIELPETSIDELISKGISSPKSGEELIVPLTIDRKTIDKYTLTPKKKHKRVKTHVTHRVYKKPKSSSKSAKTTHRSKSRSKSKTSRSKSTSLLELL